MKLIFILQWKKIIIQDIRIINLAFYLLETLSHFIGGNILKLEVISNSFYLKKEKIGNYRFLKKVNLFLQQKVNFRKKVNFIVKKI